MTFPKALFLLGYTWNDFLMQYNVLKCYNIMAFKLYASHTQSLYYTTT